MGYRVQLRRVALSGPALGGAAGLAFGLIEGGGGTTLGASVVGGLALGSLVAVVLRTLRELDEPATLRESAIIFALAAIGLGAVSGRRILHHSRDNHFVYLADSLLHDTWKMRRNPPHGNDWARVWVVTLRDGRILRGRPWHVAGPDAFRTTDGRILNLPRTQIRRAVSEWYVSFPPMPALLMMPGVAAWGMAFDDVAFTVFFGALNAVLCFLLLLEARRLGFLEVSKKTILWLTLFFTFGSVHFFSAVQGRVWYTAHIVGASFLFAFLLAALRARWPTLAGFTLAGAFLSRTPMLFGAVFFLFQALDPDLKAGRLKQYFTKATLARAVRPSLVLAAPLALLGLWMAWANWHRFGSPFEFGHTYLDIRWAERIQRWGLFNIHYLPRNLAAAFTLIPYLRAKAPYVTISRHGLSLLLTTPFLVYAIWPAKRTSLHLPVWLAIAPMALLHFTYQNSGYVQFSYRFSLDYTPLLLLVLADSGRRFGTAAKVLILVGVAWHTFGALSFNRWWQFYARSDWLFPVQ